MKETTFTDIQDEDLKNKAAAISSLGIMIGRDENEFAPSQTLTRAEASAIVKRISLAAGTVNSVSALPDSGESAISEDGTICLLYTSRCV